MKSGNLLYRLKQKWNFHTAGNIIDRKIAEINRNQHFIHHTKHYFKLYGYPYSFNKKLHGFIIDQFDILNRILCQPETSIQIGQNDIFLVRGDLRVKISTAEDIFIYNEIFINQCYHFYYPADKIQVFDVGMNVGFASLFFAQMPKVQKIIGFELFKPTYDEGIYNFNLNKSLAKKIHPLNIGLSDKSYTDVLDYSFTNKGRVGIHGTSYIKNPIVDKESISVRFEDAFKILSPLVDEQINVVLKIDTEGSELPILSSLHAGNLLKRFSLIMIEWHNHGDGKITEILKAADFSYFIINLKYDTGLIYAFRNR